MLNVALPKGRLGEKVYSMFAQAGYPCPSLLENNRKLIFENKEKNIQNPVASSKKMLYMFYLKFPEK